MPPNQVDPRCVSSNTHLEEYPFCSVVTGRNEICGLSFVSFVLLNETLWKQVRDIFPRGEHVCEIFQNFSNANFILK